MQEQNSFSEVFTFLEKNGVLEDQAKKLFELITGYFEESMSKN
jgi:hypothetical protein